MVKKKKTVKAEVELKKGKFEDLLQAKYYYLLLFVLLLVGAYLRLNHLRADPPYDLSWSLGPFTDEGAISINARNMLFWGRWLMDDIFRMGVSPLLSVLYYLIFSLFGTGFIQIRILPVFLSLGTILLVFLILKKEGSLKAALLGAFFLTTSYLFVMHNRLALEETSLNFFLILSLFFLQSGEKKRWYLLLCGFSSAISVLYIKIIGLPIILVTGFEIFRWGFSSRSPEKNKMIFRSLLLYAGGFLLAVLIWFFTIFLPFKTPLITYFVAVSVKSAGGHPGNLGEFIRNLLNLGTSDKLYPRAFYLFVLAFLYIFYFLGRWKENLKNSSFRLDTLCVFWLLLGVLGLCYNFYHPIRYQMILLPPLAILAGYGMERLIQAQKIGFRKKMSWASLLPGGAILILFFYGLFYTLNLYLIEHYQSFYPLVSNFTQDVRTWFMSRWEFIQNYPELLRASILWSGIAILIFFLLSRTKRLREGLSFPKSLKYLLIVLLLFLSIFSDLKQYFKWTDNLTYDLFETSRDLNGLPPGSVLAGPWAASLSLENHHYAIFMQNFANKDKVIERFKPTHLLIYKNGWEDKYFQETYSEIMDRAKLLKEYHIRGNPMLLYELPKE
ncbi:MAG: glycosyltransferase family 39 protein [Candidatus Zixiibacteriota bacterium]